MMPLWIALAAVCIACVVVDVRLDRAWRRNRELAERAWCDATTMLAEVRKLNEDGLQRMRIATERWQKAMDLEKQ